MPRFLLIALMAIMSLSASAQFTTGYETDTHERSMLAYNVEDMRIHMPKKLSADVTLTNVYYDQRLNEVRLYYTFSALNFAELKNPQKELADALVRMLVNHQDDATRTFVQLMRDANCKIEATFTDSTGAVRKIKIRAVKLAKYREDSF